LLDPANGATLVWRDREGTVCAYGYTVHGQHCMHLRDIASFFFSEHCEEVKAIACGPVQRELIVDAYHRTVLPMALQTLGWEVLHASGLLLPEGVAALCGGSHTGKSTLAYGLSRRGYPLWADDAVVFEASSLGVQALPLPFAIYLRAASASFFAQDQTMLSVPQESDRTEMPEREPAALAALCLLQQIPPRSGAPAVETRRLSFAEAFAAVLAHAQCFSMEEKPRKRNMLHAYLQLVKQVPVVEVRFQASFEKLPAILDGIVASLHGAFRRAS
jgi:hypothetical protein